jgi:hypothetical protein
MPSTLMSILLNMAAVSTPLLITNRATRFPNVDPADQQISIQPAPPATTPPSYIYCFVEQPQTMSAYLSEVIGVVGGVAVGVGAA